MCRAPVIAEVAMKKGKKTTALVVVVVFLYWLALGLFIGWFESATLEIVCSLKFAAGSAILSIAVASLLLWDTRSIRQSRKVKN